MILFDLANCLLFTPGKHVKDTIEKWVTRTTIPGTFAIITGSHSWATQAMDIAIENADQGWVDHLTSFSYINNHYLNDDEFYNLR